MTKKYQKPGPFWDPFFDIFSTSLIFLVHLQIFSWQTPVDRGVRIPCSFNPAHVWIFLSTRFFGNHDCMNLGHPYIFLTRASLKRSVEILTERYPFGENAPLSGRSWQSPEGAAGPERVASNGLTSRRFRRNATQKFRNNSPNLFPEPQDHIPQRFLTFWNFRKFSSFFVMRSILWHTLLNT